MIARCTKCKRAWNVSIYQKIPSSGYVCPHCAATRHGMKDKLASSKDKKMKENKYENVCLSGVRK